ncbi:SpaA isopeptide-forming pilin-related protein [Agathobaculum sp. Marseille-P7918]|uniref:SpaA isopeptide-forming pilin-related protein n=1 Tax=Agathobaculum sp. Marseille-P7918 TaxID=2479843 RepID=UPI003569F1AC
MIKDILKRATAGALSALTLLTTVPLSGAVDGGIMPLAVEDDQASSIEINVGEVYSIADKGVQKAWFQQNGAPRNVWPMYTEASDGTEIRAYCADHSKGNPGTSGMPYTVTSRVSDMHVYGVAVCSDARMTLNQFISFAGSPITAENFTADMHFSASQAAIWCALGDAQIAANSSYGVSYVSSTSLGYRAAGKTLSASSTSEALTLYAAIKMLEYGNEFYGVWGPSGKNHAPWIGSTLNYTPGNTEYTVSAQKTGTIDVGGSIVSGGTFAEKEIDGQQYMVLPMAAASATFVRGNQIFVSASNMPSGAFLMDAEGNKSTDDDGLQRLTLKNVQKNNDLYKNGNDMAYGETFLFCIPKATAEQMDASQDELQTQIITSMNASRYNVYAASTTSSGVQPVIMVEPAVQKLGATVGFAEHEIPQDLTQLKVLKTDENGAPLAGCTFQISYQQDGTPKTDEQTTDGNGEAIFIDLPLNTDVTIKETAAPEGYTLLPDKVVNTGSTGGKTVEVKLANSDDHVFKVHKVSSADGRNLMGAKFEVKGIDNDFVNTYTTDALGEFTIQGRDLPTGSFEVYEIAAPEGYATDGSDIQTFSWDNTRDVTLTFKNAPLPGIQIYKYDKDSKEPLAGATFEIRRDGQTLQTVKTDVNGYAKVYNLPKGFYQVVEVEPPQGYLKDEVEHEVYIDPSADPTQIVREVNVPNTKKLSIRIIKQDKDTKVPLQGWKFDVYYNDAKLTSVTTDENGEAMIENLQPGTYRVVEVDGDTEHYNLDAPEQTVELIKDQAEIPTLIFQNTIKKHFGIYKIDEETHKPIQGVTFEIWKDGKLLGNYTTDENGRIWLPYAEPGTYQAKEVVTDPRYIINEKTFTIENNSEYPTFFTIPNTRKKDIIVKKIDLDTGKPMQGVVFEGFKDGKSIGMFTTGPDGTFTIDYAEPGTYKFVERHTLAGYELSTVVLEGEHTTDRDLVLTLDNVEQKSFIVKKIDSETKEPLAGVQFKIWRDGVLLGDYTTDENGRIEIKNAPAGTYKVQEVKTLKEYILNDEVLEIEHTTVKDTELTVENTKQPGLLIKKVDSQTKKPLQGAVFKITRGDGSVVRESVTTDADGLIHLPELDTGTYIITEISAPDGYAIDETPKTVEIRAGQTYEVTFTNTKKGGFTIKKIDEDTRQPLKNAVFKITKSNGEFVKEAETDANGVITLDGLPEGSYIVTEIKAPDGYILQDTPKTFEIKDGGSMELVFTNKKAYGLQIRKIVKDTGEALPGAKFRVEKATGELVGEYTSNSSGLVTVSGLEDGVYVVTEIKAPDGYRLDSTPQNVIVKAGELATVTFENARLSSVRIRKIDSVTGEPISGVRFLIKDENNNLIGEYTTDSDGYIELEDDLEEGKYYAEEIEAAPGYIRDEEVKTFRVKRGETTEIEWKNTPQQGQIQITKKSKDDNPINGLPAGTLLQGATFEIYDKAGNVVDTIVSNERGVAVSKLLPLGRYTIKETKAPAYYGASGETFEAEIEFAGQIVRLEVLNESVYINVSIAKSGPKQVVPGQPIRWTIEKIANNSTVPLQSFYWRDTLPYQAVTLDKIVTGTYNARLSYKIVYRTNYDQNYRTLADNLSTAQNRTIQANPTALGLKSGEVVTDFMFVFGNVPAGFRCVETPYVYGNVRSSVAGTAFVNKADVGGLHNQQWRQFEDKWTTTIYRVTKPVLPQTGW